MAEIKEKIDYKALLEWLIDHTSCADMAPILMHWHDPEYAYVQELLVSDEDKEKQQQLEAIMEAKYPGSVVDAIEYGIELRHGKDSPYLEEFRKKTTIIKD